MLIYKQGTKEDGVNEVVKEFCLLFLLVVKAAGGKGRFHRHCPKWLSGGLRLAVILTHMARRTQVHEVLSQQGGPQGLLWSRQDVERKLRPLLRTWDAQHPGQVC